MQIDCAVFGTVDVPDELVFGMPGGLYGFEDTDQFALITKEDDGVTLRWYQSTKSRMPCFVVFDPYELIIGFEPDIEKADLAALESSNAGELDFLVLAVVPEDVSKTTVNLKSPVALNRKKQIARQVILQNDYPIKFPLAQPELAQPE
ncbi:MAG: flagellar assembly protein FliW [Oscillospiraceae bacterium]|nr:flagellar assembly protein FliW [Oscillospiraceae bacterium]